MGTKAHPGQQVDDGGDHDDDDDDHHDHDCDNDDDDHDDDDPPVEGFEGASNQYKIPGENLTLCVDCARNLKFFKGKIQKLCMDCARNLQNYGMKNFLSRNFTLCAATGCKNS